MQRPEISENPPSSRVPHSGQTAAVFGGASIRSVPRALRKLSQLRVTSDGCATVSPTSSRKIARYLQRSRSTSLRSGLIGRPSLRAFFVRNGPFAVDRRCEFNCLTVHPFLPARIPRPADPAPAGQRPAHPRRKLVQGSSLRATARASASAIAAVSSGRGSCLRRASVSDRVRARAPRMFESAEQKGTEPSLLGIGSGIGA